MTEWACVLCGHVDFSDSQLHQAIQILAHYETEHSGQLEPFELPA